MANICPSIEFIQKAANNAKSSKEAIVNSYETTEKIKSKINEIAKQEREEMKKQSVKTTFTINPNDIQTLVYRKNNEIDER